MSTREPANLPMVVTQGCDFEDFFAFSQNAADPPTSFVDISEYTWSGEVANMEGKGKGYKKLADLAVTYVELVEPGYEDPIPAIRVFLGRAYTAQITGKQYYSIMFKENPTALVQCSHKSTFTVNPQATQVLPA